MTSTLAQASRRSLRTLSSRAIACLGTLAALSSAGCDASDASDASEPYVEELGQSEDALYGNGLYWTTGTDGLTEIPVCWTFSGYDSDKEYVRSAVEGHWGAVSSVRFTGWGTCGSSTPSNAIKISEGDVTPSSNVGTTGSGVSMTLNFHYSNWNSYTYVDCNCPPYDAECVFHSKRYYAYNCDYCSDNHEFCDGLIALHEFGHALGFYHEQDRTENADGSLCDEGVSTKYNGDELTASYDGDSIMDYCGEWDRTTPHVSTGDVEGVIAAYGSKPNTLTNQVLIYEADGFSSSVQALYPGDYNLSDMGIGNDVMSSIRVPSGFTVQLFADGSYSGSSVTLTSDVARLADIGWNDRVSSVKVTGPSSSFPVIYKDASYTGASKTLRPGVYNSSGDIGIGNDALTSISVPSGWTVTLYEDANFNGSSATFTSSSSNVGSFNDKTTSIKVVGPSGWNPVVLYKDANYTGSGQALWPGRYEEGDLSIGNDALTSLTVPSGYRVFLMEHSPFWGNMKELSASQSSLSNVSFNDATSSVVVLGPEP